MPPADPDPLEKLLTAAGREVQPTVPGWQTLPARLAKMPQQYGWSLGRWATLPLGVAAAAALLLVLWYMVNPRQALRAQDLPIEVRRQSVDLTVFSAAVTDEETLYMPTVPQAGRGKKLRGQALVKDRRLVLNLKAGDNVVKFSDVATTIDPTSVRFASLTDPTGTTVVEQSFEYDLATADALLKRFVDRDIVCVDKTSGQEIAGRLASYDAGTIVLVVPGKDKERTTQNVSRGSLVAIRLAEMPADLIVKPTLVWKLRTTTPGKHETLLTYICGFVKWQADYVIEVVPGEPGQPDLLDLNGWVTLENTSGSSYPKAGLRLIAGDVRRLRDPWARVKIGVIRDRNELAQLGLKPAGTLTPLGDSKVFVEQAFFEYHLYTLNAPCTIADHQIKQLNLLKKTAVKAMRRYVFDPAAGQRNLAIELLVKNELENNLGMPLPKGSVTLQQRGADGELAVVGQLVIDHTAVKEELTLRSGHAFDIVGEQREVLVEKVGKNQRVTYEMRIRNHKAAAVAVKSYAVQLGNTGILREATMPHRVEDYQTIYFEFTLAGNAEQVIRYTVVYRSSS